MTTRIVRIALSALLALGVVGGGTASAATPVSIYGAWHCSDDACTWAKVRTVGEFDTKNHWLIDRGDGRPSVNLVILSFVNPLRLLTAATEQAGTPIGMTPEIVQLLHEPRHPRHGLDRRDHLHQGLEHRARPECDPARSARGGPGDPARRRRRDRLRAEQQPQPDRAPAVHRRLPGDPSIRRDRQQRGRAPDDRPGRRRSLADRDRARRRPPTGCDPGGAILDYANAMVPARQPSASGAISSWQEHVDGKPQYDPPIPPLAPARFTGSLYVAEGSKVRPECNNYSASLQKATASYVADRRLERRGRAPPACSASCSGPPSGPRPVA